MALFMQNKEELGVGVFTSQAIEKGRIICALTGIIRSTRDLNDDLMALQIGDDLWLTSEGSNIDDYINHSCTPNAVFGNGSCILYALRDIEEGEEIAFDYSTAMNDKNWAMDCLCETEACRKTVLPFFKLSWEHKQALMPYVLEYLADHTAKESRAA